MQVVESSVSLFKIGIHETVLTTQKTKIVMFGWLLIKVIHPPVYGKAGNSHTEMLLEMLFSVRVNPAVLSAHLHPLFLKNSSSEKSCKPLRETSFMESLCSKPFDKQVFGFARKSDYFSLF